MSVNIKRNGTLQKVAAQTILFDADCAEIRTGTYSIECMSDSGANATITFSTPMPDNDYIVIFKQESPAAGEIGFRTCTTTGFNLFVLGGRYGTAAEAMTFTGTYYAFKLVELDGYTSIYNKILNSIDSSPTQNSTNFVTSGGVYEAIANSASSFIGTQEEWENLSVAQKSQYEIVYITDDEAAVERDIYSTTETKTNKVWIDGKPIYRKVINIGALPNTSSKDVNHNISNLDKIINYYGSAQTSGGSYLCLPYASTSSGTTVQLWANSTIVRVITGTDRTDYSGYIILEYTKTTD